MDSTKHAPLLAAVVVLPSVGLAHRLGGLVGVLAYGLIGGAATIVGARRLRRWGEAEATPRAIVGAMLATVIVVVALFALLYPIANAGVVGGGSDRDDALDVAVRAWVAGRYPYARPTYLGNPITPLPGAVLLAAPFVLLGTSALQALAWLGGIVWLVRRAGARWLETLGWLWLLLLVSPNVSREIFSGGDLLANGTYVACAAVWLLHTSARGETKWSWLAALLLGVALSSRVPFVLVMPPLLVRLVRGLGWARAARLAGITALAFALVSVPWYWLDAAGFTPLHALHKASSWTVASAVAAAIAVPATRWGRRDAPRRWAQCAWIVGVAPLVVQTVVASSASDDLQLDAMGYAMLFTAFGLVGFGPGALQNDARR